MTNSRPFRFAAQLAVPIAGRTWADSARHVESLGYSTLYLPDHFGDQLAPIPAMTAAADATTDLRVGALVLDNDYKHPVVTAKELATIDLLSNGRLDVGIGAGWMTTDYEQSGIPHDPPGVRVSRMEEAITILKGLFGAGSFSFKGEHYEITDLDGTPKPVQTPHPPFVIGGGGKRVLGIAAREADIVGINPSLKAGEIGPEVAADATAAATDRKVALVRAAAGDRFDDIELSMLVFAVIETDDRDGTVAAMAGAFGLDPVEAADVPYMVVGTVPEMVESLEARRDRWGVSHLVVMGDAIETLAPVVNRLAGT